MAEPDYLLHHVFEDFETAQAFYNALMVDLSVPDEKREAIKPPRQALGNVWILDKVS